MYTALRFFVLAGVLVLGRPYMYVCKCLFSCLPGRVKNVCFFLMFFLSCAMTFVFFVPMRAGAGRASAGQRRPGRAAPMCVRRLFLGEGRKLACTYLRRYFLLLVCTGAGGIDRRRMYVPVSALFSLVKFSTFVPSVSYCRCPESTHHLPRTYMLRSIYFGWH